MAENGMTPQGLSPQQQELITQACEALEKLCSISRREMSQHERDRLEYLRLKKIFEPERDRVTTTQRTCYGCRAYIAQIHHCDVFSRRVHPPTAQDCNQYEEK